MVEDQDNASNAELWRSFASARPARRADQLCLDANDLAAWLDGRLATADHARVEAHLEACAACRRAAIEARGLLRASPRVAPPRVAVRAKSLLRVGARASVFSRAACCAAAVAAVVVVGLAGFHAGSSTCLDRQATDTRVVEEVTFGLMGPTDDLALDDEFSFLAAGGQTGGAR